MKTFSLNYREILGSSNVNVFTQLPLKYIMLNKIGNPFTVAKLKSYPIATRKRLHYVNYSPNYLFILL